MNKRTNLLERNLNLRLVAERAGRSVGQNSNEPTPYVNLIATRPWFRINNKFVNLPTDDILPTSGAAAPPPRSMPLGLHKTATEF